MFVTCFFADDSLLFCKANSEECSNILKFLSVYEASFGQKINKEKTAFFFNKSMMNATKKTVGSQIVAQTKKE